MKRLYIKSALAMVTILFIVTGCEKEIIQFDASKNLVGFSSSALVVKENLSGTATMYFGAATGTESTTITLAVDTVGLGKASAKEGVDFNLSSKSIPINVGEATVDILPVNNTIFTGDKKFYLLIASNSKNYRISAQKRILVTISDDEHPLKTWLGSYTVAAASYGDPGNWDETWNVMVSPVDGELNKVSITGLGNGSTTPLIATIDKVALTISISSAQELGEAYGPGNGMVKLYFGTTDIIDMVMAQTEVTSTMLTAASGLKITGTIETNGKIHLDKMAMVLTDYDWCWDVFNTTWNK
jgi:hypothetical protein